MAGHVSGAWNFCFFCRHHFYDYCRRNNRIQFEQRPSDTRFGTGKITAVSVLTTAVALFGFSVSHSFLALCLWGIPYGLGAGSVDAALNNYVALHYKARHMSWLHCMWGVGCSTGPVVMGYAINHSTWNNGYRTIALFQIVLTLILFFSLPLWQKPSADASADENSVPEQRNFSRLIRVPGVKEVLTCFSATAQ